MAGRLSALAAVSPSTAEPPVPRVAAAFAPELVIRLGIVRGARLVGVVVAVLAAHPTGDTLLAVAPALTSGPRVALALVELVPGAVTVAVLPGGFAPAAVVTLRGRPAPLGRPLGAGSGVAAPLWRRPVRPVRVTALSPGPVRVVGVSASRSAALAALGLAWRLVLVVLVRGPGLSLGLPLSPRIVRILVPMPSVSAVTPTLAVTGSPENE